MALSSSSKSEKKTNFIDRVIQNAKKYLNGDFEESDKNKKTYNYDDYYNSDDYDYEERVKLRNSNILKAKELLKKRNKKNSSKFDEFWE